MDDSTFWNLLIGPLGRSFSVIRSEGHLFSKQSFEELDPEDVKRFNRLSGRNEKRLFCVGYSEEEKLMDVVTELEMKSLIQASEIMKRIVYKMNSAIENGDELDDKEIIERFDAEYKEFTGGKVEPTIYR